MSMEGEHLPKLGWAVKISRPELFWKIAVLINYEKIERKHFSIGFPWEIAKKIEQSLFKTPWKSCISNISIITSWQLTSETGNIYLFKVSNRNSRKNCEICSKLTIKTLE